MGTFGKDSEMGGRQPKGLRDVFQGGSAGGAFIKIRELGADTPRGMAPAKLPEKGPQADNGEETKVTGGWGLGVTTAGDSD